MDNQQNHANDDTSSGGARRWTSEDAEKLTNIEREHPDERVYDVRKHIEGHRTNHKTFLRFQQNLQLAEHVLGDNGDNASVS